MILIKKISIFCVFNFLFIFCLTPALVKSADIDEINIMLREEKDKLGKLRIKQKFLIKWAEMNIQI